LTCIINGLKEYQNELDSFSLLLPTLGSLFALKSGVFHFIYTKMSLQYKLILFYFFLFTFNIQQGSKGA